MQYALFKITTKQYLECLMTIGGGGAECFIEDSLKAMIRELARGGGAERFIEDSSEAMLRLLMMLDFDT